MKMWVLFVLGCLPAMANLDKLKPCPDKPNCVSTLAKDEGHQIASIPFVGEAEKAISRVKKVAEAMGWDLISSEGNYLHFVATTAILRFKDDVEFVVDGPSATLHFRSASRIGYSDLGKNRSRMEDFRLRFAQQTD